MLLRDDFATVYLLQGLLLSLWFRFDRRDNRGGLFGRFWLFGLFVLVCLWLIPSLDGLRLGFRDLFLFRRCDRRRVFGENEVEKDFQALTFERVETARPRDITLLSKLVVRDA